MSTESSQASYAGVPLPEVRISTQRLLMAETTEKVLNAIVNVKDIRQINLKGESLPATINSGPNRGIANNHSERRMIKYGDKEIDAAVKPILKDIGYGIDVGRYSKYRPTA